MSFDAQAFARVLKVKRAERGWSQADLAKETGISQFAIARYETAEMGPGLDKACQIAQAFNCTVDELLGTQRPHDV